MSTDESVREIARAYEAGSIDRPAYEESLAVHGLGWTHDEHGRPMWRDPAGHSITTGSSLTVPAALEAFVQTVHGLRRVRVPLPPEGVPAEQLDELLRFHARSHGTPLPANVTEFLLGAPAAIRLIERIIERIMVVLFWATSGSFAAILTFGLETPYPGAPVLLIMLIVLAAKVAWGEISRRRT